VLDCGRNGVIALNGGAIKFDDPLTKEIVSKNNYGGGNTSGNWGCQKIVTEMKVVSQPDKLNKSFN